MEIKITERLTELEKEFNTGKKMLSELEGKEIDLKNSLLRISGAIQVLEELSSASDEEKVDNVKSIKQAGSGD